MSATKERISDQWRIPDELWERMEPLLPKRKRRRHRRGRKPLPWRQVIDGIFYVLRTGCQWKAAPAEFGSGSSLHRYFQRLVRSGIFAELWKLALEEYDELKGIQWEWQSIDGAMTKAPLGGEATGPNPTDRAKSGAKRSVLTDGRGVPLGVAVSGANIHDKNLTRETLESIPVRRPRPSRRNKQHLCADKGYDYPDVRQLVRRWGYTVHIKSRGEEASERGRVPGYRSRRWVVERTHSWLNRFRRLLIRWEKKAENFLALLHFAFAWITLRAAGILG